MILEDKEKSLTDWMAMTSQSWTYQSLTAEQRARWEKLQAKQWFRDAVQGTYKQRWNALQSIYFAFLEGIEREKT